jgi:hypothetical protein
MNTLSKLTVLAPVVNLRRGPNDSAGFLGQAHVGEQFEVEELLSIGKIEQWARVRLPEREDLTVYLCVKLPSGKALCQVQEQPAQDVDAYRRGQRDMLERILRWLAEQRALLE